MICILLPYKTPETHLGGPIKSIIGSCHYLEDEFEYKILTQSDDFRGTSIENTVRVENLYVLSKFTPKKLFPLFQRSSIIWINSIYSVSFSLIPIITLLFSKRKTILISTRGQLLIGALSLKKRIYLQAYKRLLKISGHSVYIHYATAEEKEKSYYVFKNFPSVVFANPLFKKNRKAVVVKNNSNIFIIGYFGRIAPIKNIEFVIKLLPQLPDFMEFHIYGIVTSTTYQIKLKKLVRKLDLFDRVKFKGGYSHSLFNEYANQVDLIVLPSISESFCYVLFEAIENNIQVIASTGLPWKIANGYESNTLLPLEEAKWVEQIISLACNSQDIKDKKLENLNRFYSLVASSIKQDTLQSFKRLRQ